MKLKQCGRRSGKQGGLILFILVAVAVAVILVAGVWVALKIISWVQQINPDHERGVAMVETFIQNGDALVAVTSNTNNQFIPAPPREPVITVLESVDLNTWTKSPLSISQILLNLNSRTNLTNNQCFYLFVYE